MGTGGRNGIMGLLLVVFLVVVVVVSLYKHRPSRFWHNFYFFFHLYVRPTLSPLAVWFFEKSYVVRMEERNGRRPHVTRGAGADEPQFSGLTQHPLHD